MKVNRLHLLEGSRQARGLTVIIDVFRAFSLECYLYSFGVKKIRPVGSIEEAMELKKRIPNSIMIGERGGRKIDGFDFGNSPSTVKPDIVWGKTVIHTTSAGTQGIVNAANADEIITGSFVNAKAIARYIMSKNPQEVSLVSMGDSGRSTANEDELCAEYISALLTGKDTDDAHERILGLRFNGGEKFFNPNMQDVYPSADFDMCIDHDRFPFVIRVEKDRLGFVTVKIDVDMN